MIPLAISLALRTRSMLGAMLGWIGHNPIVAALCGAVVALTLCVHVIGVKDRTIARLTAQAVSFRDAQAQATVIAQQALHHQEAVYQARALTGDQNHAKLFAAAQSAVDDLRARNSLLAKTVASNASATIAAPQGGNPGVPATVPTDSQFSVSEADVRACASATAYAVGAHDWALGLNGE